MNIIDWFKQSNRWKHFFGGAAIGALANSWYCALLAGGSAAGCLELKDKLYGNKWDWIDFVCTIAGTVVGFGASVLIANLFTTWFL
jgi:uncharacterized membrane protein YoaK (UPF0700 family)